MTAFHEEFEKLSAQCRYLRYIWCHCPFKDLVAWQLFMKNARSQMLYKDVCQLQCHSPFQEFVAWRLFLKNSVDSCY
jgi:hypothetical protein